MAKKQNAFLARLQAQAAAREAVKTEAHVEIAEAILKELSEDQSAVKELVVIRRDLAARLKGILGTEGWEKYKTLFPFLRDYW